LRSVLGEDILSSAQDQIVLQAGDRLWCDAIAFQKAVASGDVQGAVKLYGGEFLAGLELDERAFTDWVSEQRRKFTATYHGTLTRATEQALEAGDAQLAVLHAQALTRGAPLDGDAAVLEATALITGGRRAEAITALTMYAQRMEAELGSKPSEAARSMLQSILNSAPAGKDRANGKYADESRFRRPEFVGRERELAQLLALWRRASVSDGRACVIAGEAGIGKSRLVSEFLERAPSISVPLTLQGQDRPASVAMPYASIAEALRPALNAPGLAGASQHLLAEAARLLPELRDQFDLPAPVALSDDTERVRFFEGIAALVDAVSYEQPVCMVLEDLHYASGSTLELVRYLSRRLRASPVLIVATWSTKDGIRDLRQEGAAVHGHPEIVGTDSGARVHVLDEFERIELKPLSREEAERMIAALLEAGEGNNDEVRRLAGLSGGQPLRLTELAEKASEGAIPAALPMTVRDVLWRRLQECSPHEQRLFVAAALFSQAVGIRLLAAASHMSESAALEGVLSLERRGLLVQRDGRLTTASAAAAELALQTTGAAGVTLLAGWAGDALAADSANADGELARLYALAERRQLAYRHARAAALAAAACGAQEEAERFIDLAVASSSTEKERVEIDALARSFGRTGLRLSASAGDAAAAAEPPAAPQTAASEPNNIPDGDHPPRKRPGNPFLRAVRAHRWILLIGAVALTGAFAVRSRLADRTATRGNVLGDTLILVERLGSREQRYYLATGLVSSKVQIARGVRVPSNAPTWVDSLSLPWINPRVSPDGRMVAVERVTPRGVAVYVIDSESREATAITPEDGDHLIEAWSPDGSRLLVIAGR
ncbi:MAG: AAA family ATPase, partial [Gemmatimonadaceae bacterium]